MKAGASMSTDEKISVPVVVTTGIADVSFKKYRRLVCDMNY